MDNLELVRKFFFNLQDNATLEFSVLPVVALRVAFINWAGENYIDVSKVSAQLFMTSLKTVGPEFGYEAYSDRIYISKIESTSNFNLRIFNKLNQIEDETVQNKLSSYLQRDSFKASTSDIKENQQKKVDASIYVTQFMDYLMAKSFNFNCLPTKQLHAIYLQWLAKQSGVNGGDIGYRKFVKLVANICHKYGYVCDRSVVGRTSLEQLNEAQFPLIFLREFFNIGDVDPTWKGIVLERVNKIHYQDDLIEIFNIGAENLEQYKDSLNINKIICLYFMSQTGDTPEYDVVLKAPWFKKIIKKLQ